MDITNKIEGLLGEATVPSQGGIRTALGKGLKGVDDIVFKVSMSLWHYFDLKIVGIKNPNTETTAKIFKTQSSKKLADELWQRVGKNVEDSEQLDDSGIKKLKKNFYALVNKWEKVYTYNSKANGWEFTG